jgi:hypothetical protein
LPLLTNRRVPPAVELLRDFDQSSHPSLALGLASEQEALAAPTGPADMLEAKKVERFGLALATLGSAFGGEPASRWPGPSSPPCGCV